MRLKASTARKIARPGKIDSHGAVCRNVRPSFSIVPHDGLGGCTPRPRYPRLASMRIADDNPSAAWTMIGETTLGRTWRNKQHTPAHRQHGPPRRKPPVLGQHRGTCDAEVARAVHDGDGEDSVELAWSSMAAM